MSEPYHILVIDDEPVIRDSYYQILSRNGCEVWMTETGTQGIAAFSDQAFDVVILDMKLPDMGGREILELLREKKQDVPVIVITAYPTVEGAVEMMRHGAFDYIPKPFTPGILRSVVTQAFRLRRSGNRKPTLEEASTVSGGVDTIVGESTIIRELKQFIRKAGMSDCSVLITGETGTGKELAAHMLHHCSRRRNKNFISIDSGGIVDTLVESELFGHVKGAFTGAYTDRIGRFEMADQGTVFFDEITNMTHRVQGKLLRILQEQEFSRVGSSHCININVRVIAATNQNIVEEIGGGLFRKDLFYRLNVISIHMPPLRERIDDIPVLTDYFLARLRQTTGKQYPCRIAPEAMKRMMDFHWPGNVRELLNTVERTFHLCDEKDADPFAFEHCPAEFDLPAPVDTAHSDLLSIEREHIGKIFVECRYNKSQTAKVLGIDRKTLRHKLQKYHIHDTGSDD